MKYNSIGEQLIAKAKELDPSYKPDKFNDMSEAIDVILNNSGSGSDLYFDLSPFMETMQLDAEALEKFQNDITEGKIIGVTIIGTGLYLNYKGIMQNRPEYWFYFSNSTEAILISPTGAISTGNSIDIPFLPTDASTKNYALNSVNGTLTWNTIGNGLEIKNGALISNLSNFKYGTLRLKNITSTNNTYTNTYTIELSFFDYFYDVIINGANQLMGTSLTRDTFPSFLKNNITPQLFTTLITNIIDIHRKAALMPYFDVTIFDHNNEAIMANCSTVIEGIVGFSCGTNDIDLSNITFGDTFTVEYYGSWYGD